jgi:hypothetical protein
VVTKKDTRKGDRHRPGYWVEYGRKRRAREKEQMTEQTLPPPQPNKYITHIGAKQKAKNAAALTTGERENDSE